MFHWHGINQEMDKKDDKIVEILENLDSKYKSKNIYDLKTKCSFNDTFKGELKFWKISP